MFYRAELDEELFKQMLRNPYEHRHDTSKTLYAWETKLDFEQYSATLSYDSDSGSQHKIQYTNGDIFGVLSQKEPKSCLIITGEVGSGKTTLCRKLQHDWYNQPDPSSLLCAIECRHIGKTDNVPHAIHKQLLTAEDRKLIIPGQIQVYLDSGKSECTVILDGYDEIMSRRIEKMLIERHDRLKLLVTVRQSSSLNCKISERFTKLYLCQFSDKMIGVYVKSRFPESWSDKLKIIKRNKEVEHHAHKPILLPLICHVLDNSESNRLGEIQTLSKLFDAFVEALFHQHYKNFDNYDKTVAQEKLLISWFKLGKLALSVCTRNTAEYHLTSDDIRNKEEDIRNKEEDIRNKEVIDEWVRVGLLVRKKFVPSGDMKNPRDSFEFPHRLFLEKCVGKYFSNVDKENGDLNKFLGQIRDCNEAIAYKHILVFACPRQESKEEPFEQTSTYKVMEKLVLLENSLHNQLQTYTFKLQSELFKLGALLYHETQYKEIPVRLFPPLLSELSVMKVVGSECLHFMYFLEFAFKEPYTFQKLESIQFSNSTWGIKFDSFCKWIQCVFPRVNNIKIVNSEVLFESNIRNSEQSNVPLPNADVSAVELYLEGIPSEFSYKILLDKVASYLKNVISLSVCCQKVKVLTIDSPEANGSSQCVTSVERLALSSCKQNVSLVSLLQLACVSCPYLTSLSLTDLQLSLTEDGIYQVTREPESALACDSMPQLRRVSLADIQNEIQFHYLLKILSHFCSQITALELTKCNVTISDKKVDSSTGKWIKSICYYVTRETYII